VRGAGQLLCLWHPVMGTLECSSSSRQVGKCSSYSYSCSCARLHSTQPEHGGRERLPLAAISIPRSVDCIAVSVDGGLRTEGNPAAGCRKSH
jgi:hypothetical protein